MFHFTCSHWGGNGVFWSKIFPCQVSRRRMLNEWKTCYILSPFQGSVDVGNNNSGKINSFLHPWQQIILFWESLPLGCPLAGICCVLGRWGVQGHPELCVELGMEGNGTKELLCSRVNSCPAAEPRKWGQAGEFPPCCSLISPCSCSEPKEGQWEHARQRRNRGRPG